ncbi:MAG: OmpA family protein [Pseudomonadota bacterium]|nr:OmpA family protein [Pseudomonadota bacterium]
MRYFRTMTALALSGSLIATAACTTDPNTGQRRISRTAIGAGVGLLGGYLAGDVVGGRSDRTAKIIGAGVGALAGGAVGAYMDRQEAELRRQTAGTGVDVIRNGDDLILRMPSGITFPVDSYAIQPQFQQTLNEVARTLGTYNQTYVDVLGHTDSTGSDAYNQTLSVNRAQAVANYLSSQGVAGARLGVRGYGESAPIASNDTEMGRAQNRRVEIKVVPVTQGQPY